MGLTQALATSLSGLQATQTALSVVAGNVANAQTPGYVAQSVSQVALTSGDAGDSVRVTGINRLLDTFVQQQLRTETSGGAYADLNASFYQQLQQVYGQPGSNTTLDATFNNFTSAVQALSTSPNSPTVQSQTIGTAQALAAQLNSATASIQALRSQADQGIAGDVQQANNALQQIANINQQLQSSTANDSAKATLEDQRDQYIDQLSKLMDIRVNASGNDQVTIYTTSGTQLVGTQAAQLSFSATGSVSPTQQWSSNPAQSELGTITLVPPGGGGIDLLATGAIRSGEIAAYVNMRDTVLVQAQGQIDALAAQMSSALSDTTSGGTAVTAGAQNGFDTNIGNMLAGNTTQVTYTDSSNVQHTISIVRVDDPAALPLSNSVTSNPNDTVIGVNFSGGMASVVTQLNTALGATGLQFSNPGGNTLRVLDSGPGTVTVNSVATTTTATSLTGGSGALPLFVDGGTPYSGAITAAGSQSVGYAGRIQVNAALIADPTKLVTYQTGTPAGDSTRPNFIYNQLANTPLQFSPSTGIGTASSPYQGTLSAYLSQVVSTQSLATTAASNLQSGQDIVVNALQTRFNATSAVNIDTEMANLLTLQNNYGANARVMATVKAMLDTLLQM
ncbi:MAG TPA: flagellar hook-associated protein FlgK [Pseudolabrys sp.]|nr:flagellar hook-associated protein FlgK [Pseudolabrys sp.]